MPMRPIIGGSMQMHDRENKNPAVCNTIDYPKRKPVRQTPPDFSLHDRPSGWKLNDVMYRGINPKQKIVPQPWFRFFVIKNGAI